MPLRWQQVLRTTFSFMFPSVVDALISNRQRAYLQQIGLQDPKKCEKLALIHAFVVVTVYSRLSGFDVKMLEAAKDLGASEFTILRKIIMPKVRETRTNTCLRFVSSVS